MARVLPERLKKFDVSGMTEDHGFEAVDDYLAKLSKMVRAGVGLCLLGPAGTGKTGALAAVYNSFTTRFPRWGARDRMWTRARDVATSYGYFLIDDTFDETVDSLYENARWLVIDELGRESDVKNFERRMHNLVSKRRDNNFVTHFASNMDADEVRKVYGEAFWSLLHEACIIVQVDEGAPDRRL